jgi:cytochrome c-type biogenesis protein CcsB
MHVQLLGLALGLYSVGLAHSVLTILRKKQTLYTPAVVAMVLGFVSHVASMILLAYESQSIPLGQRYNTFSLIAAVAVLAFLLVHWRYKIYTLGIFAFPAIWVMTFMAAMAYDPNRLLPEAVQSNWIFIHTPAVLLGYVALFVAFSAAVLYLLQARELKSKHPRMFYDRLPSLELCDDLAYRALAIGFPLMTLGIVSGALWAQSGVLGSAWIRDPKTILSFFTWLIYLMLIHYRLIAGWRGKKAAYLAIAGFVGVLVTFSFRGFHAFTP